MARILVFDTTLRDGEQSPGYSLTPPQKLRIAHELHRLGVDVIEAGFPTSSPEDLGAVRKIAEEVRGPIICGLSRCRDRDIEDAARAVEPAERARIHVFIATSELHLARKLGISREECIERAVRSIEKARGYADDIEFSAEDATRSDPAFLAEVVRAALAAGASTINVPDTVGYTLPEEYSELLTGLQRDVPELAQAVLSVHCHNDLGLAVANSIAAIQVGARQVECTINGIGERAGNAALEEIVMALRVRRNRLSHETGIRTEGLNPISRTLSTFTGITPQPNKAIVGANAFAHEAGIHQDGMLKDRETYEIMTPEMVGAAGTRLVLGKHSGRHALRFRLRELGHSVEGEALDRAYLAFVKLTERKREVTDEDLLSILQPEGSWRDIPGCWRLNELEVTCGGPLSRARLRLARDGEAEIEVEGEGEGPIAAAFAAIERCSDGDFVLDDLQVKAATPGREAVGEVEVFARIDGRSFRGHAASTDIIEAATRACLQALDKSTYARLLEARVS